MSDDNHLLVPGQVTAEQFDLLLEGTSIRGVKVIAALREHLLTGVTAKQACKEHGASTSQVSINLKALQNESDRVAKLSKYYQKT